MRSNHTETSCTWFKPYINTGFSACKKCGKETVVMLTGKRKPSICAKCDLKRLNKHVTEFKKIMKLSALQKKSADTKSLAGD